MGTPPALDSIRLDCQARDETVDVRRDTGGRRVSLQALREYNRSRSQSTVGWSCPRRQTCRMGFHCHHSKGRPPGLRRSGEEIVAWKIAGVPVEGSSCGLFFRKPGPANRIDICCACTFSEPHGKARYIREYGECSAGGLITGGKECSRSAASSMTDGGRVAACPSLWLFPVMNQQGGCRSMSFIRTPRLRTKRLG